MLHPRPPSPSPRRTLALLIGMALVGGGITAIMVRVALHQASPAQVPVASAWLWGGITATTAGTGTLIYALRHTR